VAYPANAFLYAARKGLPLVTNNPYLPIPAIPTESPKDNATLLATIMAIECINIALPALPSMTVATIAEMRAETRESVRPFRREMLKMTKDLNVMLASNATMEDVQRSARFLAQSQVMPALEELREVLNQPKKPWYRRATDLAKEIPELATSYATMPTNIALAKSLAKIAGALADTQDRQREAEERKRTGMYFLLKVSGSAK
jgi:hypothetical protein